MPAVYDFVKVHFTNILFSDATKRTYIEKEQ